MHCRSRVFRALRKGDLLRAPNLVQRLPCAWQIVVADLDLRDPRHGPCGGQFDAEEVDSELGMKSPATFRVVQTRSFTSHVSLSARIDDREGRRRRQLDLSSGA